MLLAGLRIAVDGEERLVGQTPPGRTMAATSWELFRSLAGRRSLALEVNTTDEAANDAMVRRCVETLGAVDVLVAAAGVASPRRPGTTNDEPHTVLSIPTDDFRAVIDVNLYGVFHSNRATASITFT